MISWFFFFGFQLKEIVNFVGLELVGRCAYLDLCTVRVLVQYLLYTNRRVFNTLSKYI